MRHRLNAHSPHLIWRDIFSERRRRRRCRRCLLPRSRGKEEGEERGGRKRNTASSSNQFYINEAGGLYSSYGGINGANFAFKSTSVLRTESDIEVITEQLFRCLACNDGGPSFASPSPSFPPLSARTYVSSHVYQRGGFTFVCLMSAAAPLATLFLRGVPIN